MFFLKFESAQKSFTPSYHTMKEETKETSLSTFVRAFNPFVTGRDLATLIVTLYEAGESMGEEKLIHQVYTKTLSIPEYSHEQCSYRHPQDYTVYQKELPEGLLEELATLTKWEHFSFPNGSSYYQQKLPTGKFTLPRFGEITISSGYHIRHGWNVYSVSNARYAFGPGTDLGIHFNTRDRGLVAFRDFNKVK